MLLATITGLLVTMVLAYPEGGVVGASKMARNIEARERLQVRERFFVERDDTARPLTDLEEITSPRPGRLAITWA